MDSPLYLFKCWLVELNVRERIVIFILMTCWHMTDGLLQETRGCSSSVISWILFEGKGKWVYMNNCGEEIMRLEELISIWRQAHSRWNEVNDVVNDDIRGMFTYSSRLQMLRAISGSRSRHYWQDDKEMNKLWSTEQSLVTMIMVTAAPHWRHPLILTLHNGIASCRHCDHHCSILSKIVTIIAAGDDGWCLQNYNQIFTFDSSPISVSTMFDNILSWTLMLSSLQADYLKGASVDSRNPRSWLFLEVNSF